MGVRLLSSSLKPMAPGKLQSGKMPARLILGVDNLPSLGSRGLGLALGGAGEDRELESTEGVGVLMEEPISAVPAPAPNEALGDASATGGQRFASVMPGVARPSGGARPPRLLRGVRSLGVPANATAAPSGPVAPPPNGAACTAAAPGGALLPSEGAEAPLMDSEPRGANAGGANGGVACPAEGKDQGEALSGAPALPRGVSGCGATAGTAPTAAAAGAARAPPATPPPAARGGRPGPCSPRCWGCVG